MTERVEMKHPDYSGKANVLPEHIQTWEAKGWKVCPARGPAPAKKRALKTAEQKGQNDD